MEIKDWSSAKDTASLYRELKQLDLLEHLAELEAFGYTVLPPDKVGPADQHEEAKEAVLRIACERKDCSRDELGDAFNEHLTGWAANIQPLDLNWSRRGLSEPDVLRAIDVRHWDEDTSKERDTA
jgi:hypothetical protein